jgi:transmembrane sensor
MNSVEKEKLERYFNSESGSEDAAYIQETFTDECKKNVLKSFLAHQWNAFLDRDDLPEKGLDHVLHKIHFNIHIDQNTRENRPFSRMLRIYYRVAAVILLPLLIAGGILFFRQSGGEKNYSRIVWAEIHSTMGSRVSFYLPDGSTGWLNSGSTLKYALNFNENRRVELEGEAYFDVVPDKFHPFFVRTSEIQIKVLGTTFNLKSYPEDKTVEATLLTGILEIQTLPEIQGSKQTVILKPHQKATFQRSTDQLVLGEERTNTESSQGIRAARISNDVDAVPVISWKDHKLVFVNEPFESLLVKLERWYDVEITLLNNPADNLSYTGVFEKETVEQALRALELATPDFNYTINKNKITVSFGSRKHQKTN